MEDNEKKHDPEALKSRRILATFKLAVAFLIFILGMIHFIQINDLERLMLICGFVSWECTFSVSCCDPDVDRIFQLRNPFEYILEYTLTLGILGLIIQAIMNTP